MLLMTSSKSLTKEKNENDNHRAKVLLHLEHNP